MSDIFEQFHFPDSLTEEKAAFLKDALNGSLGLSSNQLIPYFTGLIRKANQQKLQFTDEEVRLLLLAIRSTASSEDNARIDQLLHIKPG